MWLHADSCDALTLATRPPCGLRWRVTAVTPTPRNRHTHPHQHTSCICNSTCLLHPLAVTSHPQLCRSTRLLSSDHAAIDPRPLLGRTRLLGERLRLPQGELVEARGQLHQVLLRLLGLGREAGHLSNLPELVEMLHDLCVVDAGVDVEVGGDAGEVIVQIGVGRLVHELGRHDDLLVHHVLVREDSAARVEPEHFLHEELVRLLMACLVACDARADPRQRAVARGRR
mmetsp:Transcript_23859/g.56958  ORF Transcript_23859/g.56958 Transcript_23859/m.56958 type:complete len:228 (-) Transcript_23859:740-1423(-)